MTRPDTSRPDTSLISRDPGLCARYQRDVSIVAGLPDAVLRPRDTLDVKQAIAACAGTNTAVLPVGGQTSTTGASVPVGGGLVLDMTAFELTSGDPEIDAETGHIRTGPGVTLATLRDLAARHGWDLPVDPTSAATCTIGGAVATNASGPSSFRHGAMAAWVDAVQLVDGRGRAHSLRRPQVPKVAMGPAALQDPVRWMVGSEGTLGVMTQITVRLRRRAEAVVGALVGFDTRDGLLAAVASLRRRRDLGLRALEWLDAGCCQLLVPHARGLRMPSGQGGALFLTVEGDRTLAPDQLQTLLERLPPHGGAAADAQLLLTSQQLQAFDVLRHHVPDELNQVGRRLANEAGGGKLSTDWSAPIAALPALFDWGDAAFADLGLVGLYRYGHIGDGHPHLNLMCPNAEVRDQALAQLRAQLVRVVAAGGVPVSEHGIGKLKRELVAPYLPPGARAAWLGLKAEFDPAGILAPGNLFAR